MSSPATSTLTPSALPVVPVPWRYLALVGLAAPALFVLGQAALWTPWVESGDTLAGSGWSDLAASVSVLLWAAAPAVALWRPWVGGAVAASPFAITLLDVGRTWPLALFASLVICAAAATWRNVRSAVVIAGVALVPVLTYVVGFTTIRTGYGMEVETRGASLGHLGFEVLLYALVALAAVGLGSWMRASWVAGRQAAALAGRAGDVERESAVVGERARLARDLHDVVAHHVSLIAVRAETAPYTVPDLSQGARDVLAAIAEDSRRALDELRGVLGVLRRSSEEPQLAPQPGAADLELLVETARRSGEQVEWTRGELVGVSAAAGYAAYRVVQEALTNARRHAPGAPVRVETVAVGAGVLVRVDNACADGVPAEVGEGRGLSGMRERVEALGGTLSVRVEDGWWRVEAAVPGGPA
jgi:signal transduction histidine kinase